jgi:hypothetical protein
MSRLKPIPIAVVVFTLAVGTCAARAETPTSNNAPVAANYRGDSLTERGLATASDAASKIGNAIDDSAPTYGSGVQHVTNRATD